MFSFWIKRKNQNCLKIAAVTVVSSLLFSALLPPFADARRLNSSYLDQGPTKAKFRKEQTSGSLSSNQFFSNRVAKSKINLDSLNRIKSERAESLDFDTDSGLDSQKFFHTLDQYVERLEDFKIGNKDKEIEEQINKIIKEIKKSLSFSKPFVKNDKEYKIGVYQGEKKKALEFIVQNTMRELDQLMAGQGNLGMLLSTLKLETPLAEDQSKLQEFSISPRNKIRRAKSSTVFFRISHKIRVIKNEFGQLVKSLESEREVNLEHTIFKQARLIGVKLPSIKARLHWPKLRRGREVVRDKQFLHGIPFSLKKSLEAKNFLSRLKIERNRVAAIRFLTLKEKFGEKSEEFKAAVTEKEPIWETKAFPLIGFLIMGAALILGDWDLVKVGFIWATGFFALAHPLYSFSFLIVGWTLKAIRSGEDWQVKIAALREETINFLKETAQSFLSPLQLEPIALAITTRGERGIFYQKPLTSNFKVRVTQPLDALSQPFISLQTIKSIFSSLKTVVKVLIIDLPILTFLSFFFLAPYLLPFAPIFALSFVPDLFLRIIILLIFFKPMLHLVKIATSATIKLHQKYNLWVYENNLSLPYARIFQGLGGAGVSTGVGENLQENLREHAALALAEVKKSLKRHYKKIADNERRREQGLYITMDMAGKQDLLKEPPKGINEIIKYLEKKGHPEPLHHLESLIKASLEQNDFSKYLNYIETMDRYLPLVYWMNLLRRLKPMMEMPEIVDLAYSLEVLPQSAPFLSLPEDGSTPEVESIQGEDEVGNPEELLENRKRRIEELNLHWEEIKQEAETGSSKIFKELANIFYEKKEDQDQASELSISLFRWGASANTIFAALLHKHFPEDSSVTAKQIEDLLNSHFKEKAVSLTTEKLPQRIIKKIKELLQSKVTLEDGKKEEEVIRELIKDLVQEKPVKSSERISGLLEKHGIQFKDERSKEEIAESIKRLINREMKGVDFFELKDRDLNEIVERLNRLRSVHQIPYDFPIDVKGPPDALMNQIDLSLKMVGDPESLLLVLADRYYALETAPEEESERITSNIQMQIRLIWATLADRVLREDIASELLTASLIKIIGKEDYEKFLRAMQVADAEIMKKNVENYLKENEIPYLQVLVRPKGAPQTINKVIRKGGLPKDPVKGVLVSDLLGVAIVFPDQESLDKAWSSSEYKINLRENRKEPQVKEWKHTLDPNHAHIGLAVDKDRAWEVKRKEKEDGNFVYTNIKFGGIEIKLMTQPDFLRGESGENAHWLYKLLQRLEEIKMELRTRQEFSYVGVQMSNDFKSNFQAVLQSIENKDFLLKFDERTGSIWPIDRNSLPPEDPFKRSSAQLYFTKPEMNLQPNSHLYNVNQRIKDLKVEQPIEVMNYNISYDKSSENHRIKLVIKVHYSIPGILHQIAGISWSCGNIVDIHTKTTNQGHEIITLQLTGEHLRGTHVTQALISEMIQNLANIKVTQEQWLKYRALNKQRGKLNVIASDRNGLVYDITDKTREVGVNVKGLSFTTIIEKSLQNHEGEDGDLENPSREDTERIEREELVFRIRMKMVRSGLRKASGEKLQFSMDVEVPEGVDVKKLENSIEALPGVEAAKIELRERFLPGIADLDVETDHNLGAGSGAAAAVEADPKNLQRNRGTGKLVGTQGTQPLLISGTQPLRTHFDELLGGVRHVNLVLEGGGVRGLAHIGAIQELEKQGFKFKSFAGTSVGAIGAAFLAVGYTGKQLEKIMEQTDPRIFTDGKSRPTWFTGLLSKLKLSTQAGLYEGNHFEEWVRNIIFERYVESTGQIKDPTFQDLLDQGVDLNIVATDLTTRDRFIFNAKNSPQVEVYKAVRASASFPYFYRPPTIRINGDLHYFSDGGIVSNRPIDIFKGEEEDTIVLGLSNADLVDEVAKIFLGDTHWMVKLNDTGSTILDMLAARVKSHDLNAQRQSQDWNEISIETQDVRIMEVNLNKSKRKELIDRGAQAVPENFRLLFEQKKIKKGEPVAIENTFKMISQQLKAKDPRAIQFLRAVAGDLGKALRAFVDGYSNPDKEFKNNIYLFAGGEEFALGDLVNEDFLVSGVQKTMIPRKIKVSRIYENKENRLLAFTPEQQEIQIALSIGSKEIEIALLDQNGFLREKDFFGRKSILWSEIEKDILKKRIKNSEAARTLIYYYLMREINSLVEEFAKARNMDKTRAKNQIHNLKIAWSGHVKSKRKVFSHNIKYFRPQDFEDPSYVQEGGVDLSSKLSGILKDSYGFNAIISIEVVNSLLAEVFGYRKNKSTKKMTREATFVKIGLQGIGAAMFGKSVGRRDHYVGELGHRIIWGRKPDGSFGYELRLPPKGRAYPIVRDGEERLEQRLSMQAIALRYLDFIVGGSLKDSNDPIVTSLHQGEAEHLIWMLLQGDFSNEAKAAFNSVLPLVRGVNDEISVPITEFYENFTFDVVQTVVSLYPKFVPYFLNAFFEKTFSQLRMKASAVPLSAQKIGRQLQNEFAMQLKFYPTLGMKSIWPVAMDQYWAAKKEDDSYHYYLAFLTRLMIGESDHALFLLSKKCSLGLASLDRKIRKKMIQALAARELMLHALMRSGLSFQEAHKKIEELAQLLGEEEQHRIKSEIKLWEKTRSQRMELQIKLMNFLTQPAVGLTKDEAWKAVDHFIYTDQAGLLFFAEKDIAQYDEIMNTIVPKHDSEAEELLKHLQSIEERYKNESYYKKIKQELALKDLTEAKKFKKILDELDEDYRLAQALFSNAFSGNPVEYEWSKGFPTDFEEFLYFLDYAGRGKFNVNVNKTALIEELFNIAILIDKNPQVYLEFKQLVNRLLPTMSVFSQDSMDFSDSIKMILELNVPTPEDPSSIEVLRELLSQVEAMKEVVEPVKKEPLDLRHSAFALAVSLAFILIWPDSIFPLIWFVPFLALGLSNLMVYLIGNENNEDKADPFWLDIIRSYYPQAAVEVKSSREMGWRLAYYDPNKNRITLNLGWVRGFENRILNSFWDAIRIFTLPWMLTQEGGRVWLNRHQIARLTPPILKDFLLYFLKPVQYLYGISKLVFILSRVVRFHFSTFFLNPNDIFRFSLLRKIPMFLRQLATTGHLETELFGKFSFFKDDLKEESESFEKRTQTIIEQVSKGMGYSYEQIPPEILKPDWVQTVKENIGDRNLRIVISVFDLPLLADKLNEFIQSFEKIEDANEKSEASLQKKKMEENNSGFGSKERRMIELVLVQDQGTLNEAEVEGFLRKYRIASQSLKIKQLQQKLTQGKFNFSSLVEKNGLREDSFDLLLFRVKSKNWEGWWSEDSLKGGWDILFKANGKELADFLKLVKGLSSMDLNEIRQMQLRDSFTRLVEKVEKTGIELELYHVQQ
ncbi:MAG: patatin-like phospholipase family protein [Elusimicrobia bacterium]|nr:patatin-like phospholipase family protein [Elusimicrobiota bacterium]